MKLDEIFNTERDLTWQRNGKFELTSFDIEDQTYVIQIQTVKLKGCEALGSENGKTTAEVLFYRQDDTAEAGFSSGAESNKTVLAIYSIVYNALMAKLKEYSAFYFSAERRRSPNEAVWLKKADLYYDLARRLAGSGAIVYQPIEERAHDREFLVTNNILLKDDSYWQSGASLAEQLFRK